MERFKLVSEYQPTGDQPQAIEKLAKGFEEGNQFETLVAGIRMKGYAQIKNIYNGKYY